MYLRPAQSGVSHLSAEMCKSGVSHLSAEMYKVVFLLNVHLSWAVRQQSVHSDDAPRRDESRGVCAQLLPLCSPQGATGCLSAMDLRTVLNTQNCLYSQNCLKYPELSLIPGARSFWLSFNGGEVPLAVF